MNARRFGNICEKSNLRLESMENTSLGTIYIAEGTRPAECAEPHIMTLWAVSKGGMEVAQPIFFKLPHPSRKIRLDEARACALEFLNG